MRQKLTLVLTTDKGNGLEVLLGAYLAHLKTGYAKCNETIDFGEYGRAEAVIAVADDFNEKAA